MPAGKSHEESRESFLSYVLKSTIAFETKKFFASQWRNAWNVQQMINQFKLQLHFSQYRRNFNHLAFAWKKPQPVTHSITPKTRNSQCIRISKVTAIKDRDAVFYAVTRDEWKSIEAQELS